MPGTGFVIIWGLKNDILFLNEKFFQHFIEKHFMWSNWQYVSNGSPCNAMNGRAIGNVRHAKYRQTTNIRRALVGNKLVDHSDVVGASLVQLHLHSRHLGCSINWSKTTARRGEKHLGFVIWCALYYGFDGMIILLWLPVGHLGQAEHVTWFPLTVPTISCRSLRIYIKKIRAY